MASWPEIERIRKDSFAARDIARILLKSSFADLSDWEFDFLEGMARLGRDEELTTRQSEKLLEIRDAVRFATYIRGFSVSNLLRGCYEGRFDLSENNEEWIEQTFKRNQTSIKRKYASRLMRCAHELNLVEEEAAA